MKVLVASRTPYEDKRMWEKYEEGPVAEDLVLLPLPCSEAREGAACPCRRGFLRLGAFEEGSSVARVREVAGLDRVTYTERIVDATHGMWGMWNPYPTGDQLEPYVEALLRVTESLPEGTLVERFGSGVREFNDAPVEDGPYDRWYGTPPTGPLRAFDVLGRVPRALSAEIEHDWLNPENRLPANYVWPAPARPVRKRPSSR